MTTNIYLEVSKHLNYTSVICQRICYFLSLVGFSLPPTLTFIRISYFLDLTKATASTKKIIQYYLICTGNYSQYSLKCLVISSYDFISKTKTLASANCLVIQNVITLWSSSRHSVAEKDLMRTIDTPRTKLSNRQSSSNVTPSCSFRVSPTDASTAVGVVTPVDTPHKT